MLKRSCSGVVSRSVWVVVLISVKVGMLSVTTLVLVPMLKLIFLLEIVRVLISRMILEKEKNYFVLFM